MNRATVFLMSVVLSGVFRSSANAADVLVFAASSLADALNEIAVAYTGGADRITFSFDASSTLARQIAAGAPADLFFSADEAKMDQLQSKGLIVEATRRSVLSNTLVVVVPDKDGMSLSTPEDLVRANRIVLANPDAVPAGIYAKAYLKRIGLWDRVAGKIVPAGNVRAALAAVESGDADAGFVYATDAAISKKTRVAYRVPVDEEPSITYPAALVAGSKNADAARKFLDHLQSPAASAIFQKFGFTVFNR